MGVRIDRTAWGVIDGVEVVEVALRAGDLAMRVTNYGCIITALQWPSPGVGGSGRGVEGADVVLGFDNLGDYIGGHPYFGAIVGRCANRIGGGRAKIAGQSRQLARNDKDRHHLHGGVKGFDKHVWSYEAATTGDGVAIRLTRTSPDGEENYPGRVDAAVIYRLGDNRLDIEMTATCDAPTLVNLAQHTYWNLAGHDRGDVLGHELQLHADAYTPVDATLIPTGRVAPVAGGPFDFRQPKPIGRDLAAAGGDPVGYDTNFIVRGQPGELRTCAVVREPISGRGFELHTDQPGVQFYSGNFLDGSLRGKGGIAYPQYGGFCLETQHYPDAINHAGFPSPVLEPGQTYRHRMSVRFEG